MGDSGSLVIGFLVAVFAVEYLETDLSATSKTPHLCIAILIVPLFDTIRVFISRLLKGQSPFAPDQNHIHHKLTQNGFTQVQTVLILLGVNLLIVLGVYFAPKIQLDYYIFGLVFCAVLVSLAFRFFDKQKENA